ncbi:DUF3343 domain-containing protein [Clostridium taeniosporum]|uniref:DUF3343 domain-containing protein n=1 Tax=Clostridium taeniosporum TaxID=394958 RepID=A0A1D7XNZ5_9CLOT|nr:DUF3343 domain-containing protein [Clostridium taeniosporum]AOR24869.1 DUF3343 domain-containing protein [Clostridium taeniosporum]
MSYYIIVFKNTFDAMAAEKSLQESRYEFRIMPTPTSITQSCGICVRINEKEAIKRIIEENKFEYKSIYLKDNNGYILT